MNKKRVALVIGATGLVGGHCVRQLLDSGAYDEVVTLGRRKLNLAHSLLRQIVGELDEAHDLLADCTVDDVFCCLGTTIKKAKSKSAFRKVDYDYPLLVASLMREHGAEHFCVVSALGANSNSYFFYNKVKGELERDLQKLGYPYLTIVRPSLLLGDREEVRVAESMSAAVGNILKPIMKGVLQEVSPVEARQVAGVMVAEAMDIAKGIRYQNIRVIKSGQIQEHSKAN